MANRKKNKIESSLLEKGFQKNDGDHRFFIYYSIDGKKTTVRTKTSHTPKMKTVDDGLLGQMAKQCKLNKKDFLDLIDCPMDRNGYEEKLKAQSLV